jgi:hypothetical protein
VHESASGTRRLSDLRPIVSPQSDHCGHPTVARSCWRLWNARLGIRPSTVSLKTTRACPRIAEICDFVILPLQIGSWRGLAEWLRDTGGTVFGGTNPPPLHQFALIASGDDPAGRLQISAERNGNGALGSRAVTRARRRGAAPFGARQAARCFLAMRLKRADARQPLGILRVRRKRPTRLPHCSPIFLRLTLEPPGPDARLMGV